MKTVLSKDLGFQRRERYLYLIFYSKIFDFNSNEILQSSDNIWMIINIIRRLNFLQIASIYVSDLIIINNEIIYYSALLSTIFKSQLVDPTNYICTAYLSMSEMIPFR